MQLPYIIRAIESHAQALADAVVRELRFAPQLPLLNRVSEEELRTRALDFFANLGKWLGEGGDETTAETYRLLGAKRCEDGVPAAELVYAVLRLKAHVWDFIRRNDAWQNEVELYQADELISRVSHFFDVAIYNAVQGHESARAAGRWNVAARR